MDGNVLQNNGEEMNTLLKIYAIIEVLRDLKAKGYTISYLHTPEYFLFTLKGKQLDAYSTIRIADPEARKKITNTYIYLTELLRGKELATWKGHFYPPQDNSIDIIL